MAMKVKEFLGEVVELVRMQVAREYKDFHTLGPRTSLIKLHFGDPRFHYEIWVQRRRGIVELGLHFEGRPEENAGYLERLSARSTEIRSGLGKGVEAEQWTPRWTRVHRTVPLEPLNEDFLWEVASQTSKMITVLEPMVRETGNR